MAKKQYEGGKSVSPPTKKMTSKYADNPMRDENYPDEFIPYEGVKSQEFRPASVHGRVFGTHKKDIELPDDGPSIKIEIKPRKRSVSSF